MQRIDFKDGGTIDWMDALDNAKDYHFGILEKTTKSILIHVVPKSEGRYIWVCHDGIFVETPYQLKKIMNDVCRNGLSMFVFKTHRELIEWWLKDQFKHEHEVE